VSNRFQNRVLGEVALIALKAGEDFVYVHGFGKKSTIQDSRICQDSRESGYWYSRKRRSSVGRSPAAGLTSLFNDETDDENRWFLS